jgi:hypothetical protein
MTSLSRDERRALRKNTSVPRTMPSAGASLSIDQFCAAENINRSMYYKLRRLGLGPREMAVGAVRRISAKAREDWHRQREGAAQHRPPITAG